MTKQIDTSPHQFSVDLLYTYNGLTKLDSAFLIYLKTIDQALYGKLENARAIKSKDDSELILELAPIVEDFLADLFNVHDELDSSRKEHEAYLPIITAKRNFVQRYALKTVSAEAVQSECETTLTQATARVLNGAFDEAIFAEKALTLLNAQTPEEITEREILAKYAAWAMHTTAGKARHKRSVLFKAPQRISFDALVTTHQSTFSKDKTDSPTSTKHQHHEECRARDGFHLTDTGFSALEAFDEAHYCIWCHKQSKDSCSKGLKEKQTDQFAKNPHNITLTGCPLEEKISEMNLLKAQGRNLAALAVIIIDNPMVAATGHRICNDCMKSCIYQKQTPVNIPGAETQILQSILNLPWGFEIYSLLTRWNPLNFNRPLPHNDTGNKVLVVGLGPAGFTLAHHLMNDGHTVVGIDGLKIEPLPAEISGITLSGERKPFELVKDISLLMDDLDTRLVGGFGGVAEYGITVRWNKNYLKLIRLLLERREQFRMFGGVRFGGTLNLEHAFEVGFDHVALCLGAGKPTLIPMKNSLARGVRQASDFLMALQLTGAAKPDTLANLQLRLPVLVIGGGLTAVDTATEALAYYPRQVMTFAKRYHALVAAHGKEHTEQRWSEEDHTIATEFLSHAALLTLEQERAHLENRAPKFAELVQQWGGVSIVYRRRLQEAPSVTLNHEEVEKAMEEGIYVLDQLTPMEVVPDQYGHAHQLIVRDAQEQKITLSARSILVAAGTSPNIAIQSDIPELSLDQRTFQALTSSGEMTTPQRVAKPDHPAIFTHIHSDGRRVSFFGDLHPSFAGNVVKAMGSAKQGYPHITTHLATRQPQPITRENLFTTLTKNLTPTVVAINQLAPSIIEVVVHAPFAAQSFKPGQFYRLQNFETLSATQSNTPLAMEGLALTGASVDMAKGTISLITLEMGASSNLCRHLKAGEPVILMGPTGTATEIPTGKTVLLIGGGLGNAVLFSIGKALRDSNNRVLYFAGYKQLGGTFKQADIEAAADSVVWCCDEAPGIMPQRSQDTMYVGNLLEAIRAFAKQETAFAAIPVKPADIEHLIVIGSDGMMAAMAHAFSRELNDSFVNCTTMVASINSPMQCMMKEICAQCLQRHIDPLTGEETIVFSCVNQDQPLLHVDFSCLNQRLKSNQLQEKMSTLWLTHILDKASPSPQDI